ncbi:hypothetical protein BDR06DRAFT_121626 [Suillus hirtellus]|nr:hypothetical protein BDR06DRAFT_121626 [Suillus hirtellus]
MVLGRRAGMFATALKHEHQAEKSEDEIANVQAVMVTALHRCFTIQRLARAIRGVHAMIITIELVDSHESRYPTTSQ